MKIPKTPVEAAGDDSTKEGTVNGAGGVKVGRRVWVGWVLKAAARVRSTVAVTGGVGVGGGSTI